MGACCYGVAAVAYRCSTRAWWRETQKRLSTRQQYWLKLIDLFYNQEHLIKLNFLKDIWKKFSYILVTFKSCDHNRPQTIWDKP